MEYRDFLKISEGIADFLWNCPRPEISIDHSARLCVSKNLLIPIIKEIGSTETSMDQAYKYLMNILENDRSIFRLNLSDINDRVINDFISYYRKFGGASALFAYCLLMSCSEDDKENVALAKRNLLNWYGEYRNLSLSRLNGGIIAAWFPYEWFTEHFNEIAVTIVGSGLFEISKELIWNSVRVAFWQAYNIIRQYFNPYPEPILQAKRPESSIQDFEKFLEDAGVMQRFLYLFHLNNDELNNVIEDWAKAFLHFTSSISANELSVLRQLLDEPVSIDSLESKTSLNDMRGRKFLRVIEAGPENIRCVFYPDVLESYDGL